jgi:membrane protease YdiL (CAAX protease family)
MSTEGSLSRTTLPIGLASFSVWFGYVAMGGAADAAESLGPHARTVLSELCLAAPALLALLSFEIPAREGLGLHPVSTRAFLRTLVASGALWTCAIGLSVLQSLVWANPPGHAELFGAFWDAMTPHGPGEALLALGTVALAPAVCEEILFRGVLLPALLTRQGATAAILVSAGLFASLHIAPTSDGGVTLYQVPQALLVGIALGVLRVRSGSLLPGLLAHTLYNATTFALVMLADSDPSVGWSVAMLLLGAAVLFLALKRFQAPPPLLDSNP